MLSPTDLIEEIYGLESRNFASELKPLSSASTALTLAELEKNHILQVLRETGGHREKAAVILGITSRTLYRKLNEYGEKG